MNGIEEKYRERYLKLLVPISKRLEEHIKGVFRGEERIDQIVARPKGIMRFVEKAEKTEDRVRKYTDPLNQIQDQLGARIVTFYNSDVDRLSKIANEFFKKIEVLNIIPEKEAEFGYFGKHFIFFIPEDIIDEGVDRRNFPTFFELQIKTLFQHAWGEANHDLGYKPEWDMSSEDKRRIAFTAAQAWGADMIFNELFASYNGT